MSGRSTLLLVKFECLCRSFDYAITCLFTLWTRLFLSFLELIRELSLDFIASDLIGLTLDNILYLLRCS
ncbi:hypothetical protein PILCRDRAFT_810739 [Piloderma croceum F 1598]|uniref:Uncharacterized protein n=1 Tax=Piloderma croceum (strain F 1598) TaxID=765440 RepID=A0A0C3G5C8_PILCF|nr:hypothetical protein PILCRDRAFT_810739 [Piloderma croceum F 1598]